MTFCIWNIDAPETGIYVCQNCSQRPVKIPPPQRTKHPKRVCKNPPPPGVGDALHALIAKLGIEPKTGCECQKWIRKMNAWGPSGCEENMAAIVKHLRWAYSKTTWAEVIAGSFTALASGMALELNPLDPLGSLVRLAIERANEHRS